MNEPLISIIVPAFNLEQYLSRCLDSILAQEYKSIEIIIVNDGSTDNTGNVIDHYLAQYPSQVRALQRENTGVFQARMDGCAMARGEWIGFVDGDDVIESDMYRRLVANGIRYGVDISHCGYKTIVNDGERIHYFYNTGKIVQQDTETGVRDLLEGKFIECGLCNKLFKKSLFQSVVSATSLDTTLKVNEDLYLNYWLFKQSRKAVFEDFCPYNYIARAESVTRSQFKLYKCLDPLKVARYIMDDYYLPVHEFAVMRYISICSHAYIA